MQYPVNPVRDWRVVAEELKHERDPEKLTRLAEELTKALDEQELHKPTDNANNGNKGAAVA